jgi:hypothetical protein
MILLTKGRKHFKKKTFLLCVAAFINLGITLHLYYLRKIVEIKDRHCASLLIIIVSVTF